MPQKDMPPKSLIVKLPLPSLVYNNGSLIYQIETPVKEAIRLVLKDFTDDLSEEDMVAAINAVRKNDDASVFLILKSSKDLMRSWLLNEVKKFRLGIST
jgi:hypothetical protein